MRDRPGTIPAPGGLALLLTLTALAPPAPAGAQGRWIDIGSGVGFTITVEGEPESRALFPPYAFGTFSPGNYVYLELLLWPCSGLPDPEVCAGATFVRAFQSYLDTGTCPCTGVLFAPIALELRYDPAGSGRWGRAKRPSPFRARPGLARLGGTPRPARPAGSGPRHGESGRVRSPVLRHPRPAAAGIDLGADQGAMGGLTLRPGAAAVLERKQRNRLGGANREGSIRVLPMEEKDPGRRQACRTCMRGRPMAGSDARGRLDACGRLRRLWPAPMPVAGSDTRGRPRRHVAGLAVVSAGSPAPRPALLDWNARA